MIDTHTNWRRINAAFRLEHDSCEVAVIRPIDRETYRNANRKDDQFASFPLVVLERELTRADASCLRCEKPLQDSMSAVGIVFTPDDPDLSHLIEAFLICASCARSRDDEELIALIGGAACL